MLLVYTCTSSALVENHIYSSISEQSLNELHIFPELNNSNSEFVF